ncbi:hypothetical protein M406DRAFT_29927, partial [Cryphonectria parasitica EP155]
ASTTSSANSLPDLLHTPTGLALLELQGTINLPAPEDPAADASSPAVDSISIGRVEFPDYKPDSVTFDPSSTAWMKRVHLFVGQHQRLTGEVKKLPRAIGVVRRREGDEEALEFAEIVKYKIVFSSRPEPV